MKGTKITYHQVYMGPQDREEDSEDRSFTLPHIEAGWCQVVNAEFVGGGGDKRFLLHVIAFEPVDVPDQGK